MSLFRNLASTHFEPTSARMAFPCFDEPSFKANFSVRIRRSPEHISLSNMPVVSVMLVTAHVQMCVKKATMTLSCISGENGWGKRWPAWGPVWHKCKDEHVPRSFCHLWLQIRHRKIIFWGAGVSPWRYFSLFISCQQYYLLRDLFLLFFYCCVFIGVHLCLPWEVAADQLRPGGCCQNAGLLRGVFQHPISSAQTGYPLFSSSGNFPLFTPSLSVPWPVFSLSQIW